MPTYAYKCKDCGHALEAQQAFSDPSLTECPVCGGRLRKQYGSVGVTFNGSGFYRTDSRSDGKRDAAPKSDGTGSGSSEGTKTESKPAAKPETSAPKSGATAASTAS